METKLIGLTGLAGCGKDTFAEKLSFHSSNVKLYAFADPLKSAASAIFNVPLDVFYIQSLKEKTDPFWGISPREMLQKLGTEACRNTFGPDIWIKSGQTHVNDMLLGNSRVIVTDVRFDNEAQWIIDNGGIVIDIQRDNLKKQNKHNHVSEQGITTDKFIIKNNGTLEDLEQQAIEFAELIKWRWEI